MEELESSATFPFPTSADKDEDLLKSYLAPDVPETSPDHVLGCDLALWSIGFNIGRNALTELLGTLRTHGHPGLPKSSKTLLKTPRSTVKLIKPVGNGLFWYYGILINLIPRLQHVSGNIVTMDIFVDGVSPYKSVKQILYPICGCLSGSKDIFIIAMWSGKTKDPDDIDSYFKEFIEEATTLMEGFIHDGKDYILQFGIVVADAPARAWIKRVNIHGSYYACER